MLKAAAAFAATSPILAALCLLCAILACSGLVLVAVALADATSLRDEDLRGMDTPR